MLAVVVSLSGWPGPALNGITALQVPTLLFAARGGGRGLGRHSSLSLELNTSSLVSSQQPLTAFCLPSPPPRSLQKGAVTCE